MSDVAGTLDESQFPPRSQAWYVVGLMFFSGSFAFIDRIILSLLTPLIQADLHLHDSQMGLLQGMAFALFYTLFGVPLGFLVDRVNRKRLLTFGMTVWCVMTASSSLTSSFGALFLTRMGVGMGEACLNPCMTSLMSDYFPPRTRPRAIAGFVMGQGFGQSMAYYFGGKVLAWLAANGGLELPYIGMLKPWQAMFFLIGTAGLIPMIIFGLTVREPRRLEINNKTKRASFAEIRAFMKLNRKTLACHHLGLALTILTAYAFANWMPTYFSRAHGWTPAYFSITYAKAGAFIALAAPVTAAWLASHFKARGVVDSAWRTALTGALFCTVFGAIAPLMPNAWVSLTLYIIAGFGASLPAVLAYIAIAEFVPNEMRGVISGIYFLTMGLVATGFGPYAVGLATDYLFKDPSQIGMSLFVVSLVTGFPAITLLSLGLKPFRESISRATWATPIAPRIARR